MAKLQSTFKNMVLSLTLIALVAAGALAGIYMLTVKPIEKAQQQKQTEALAAVLPQNVEYTLAEPCQISDEVIVHKAFAGDQLVGAAVESSVQGFGGLIKLMVGFDAQGNIIDYVALNYDNETPGLGAKLDVWFKDINKPGQNIVGSNPAERKMIVSKDGGDVDAITAATISSRAFLRAVQAAYDAFMNNNTDANSGATKLNACDGQTGATTVEQIVTDGETIIEDVEQLNAANNE